MIPGSNLLKAAFRAIATTPVDYYKFSARTINNVGQNVATYEPVQYIRGSLQAVQKNLYQTYGLDLQKNYANFYVSTAIIDVQRDFSPDLIVYNNDVYSCESNIFWFPIDGWVCILLVKSDLAIPA